MNNETILQDSLSESVEDTIIPEKKKKSHNFFLKVGKRNMIILCSMLLIGAAIYLNWAFFAGDASADAGQQIDDWAKEADADANSGKILGQSSYVGTQTGTDAVDAESENYFAVSQINRQRARDEAMEVLQTIVDNKETLEEMKTQAWNDMTRIAADMEREANIETLICSKGFTECVAVINQENANIVVKSDGLLPNEVAQIKEIVYEQAGISPTNIKIIEKS